MHPPAQTSYNCRARLRPGRIYSYVGQTSRPARGMAAPALGRRRLARHLGRTENVDGDDRVRVDEAVPQHRPFALAHVAELEDRALREHERVLVRGRAADEDRLAVAEADNDPSLVG